VLVIIVFEAVVVVSVVASVVVPIMPISAVMTVVGAWLQLAAVYLI